MLNKEGFTVKEFAEALSIEETDARGLVNALLAANALAKVGERRRPDGKGKAATLYGGLNEDVFAAWLKERL